MPEEYTTCGEIDANLNCSPTKPPFGYYGAKQRLARKIITTLPPHNAWVEAFCGTAAITLAKPPALIEIINDLDDEVVNLFRQLRSDTDAVLRAVALTPYARAEFMLARTRSDGLDNLERARRFLVSTMMTVNGTVATTRAGFSFSQSYARQKKEARVCRWHNLSERLSEVVERLRNVRIENRDARELLGMFSDRPATLVYLDPPYFTKRSHRYVIDVDDRRFHTELLEICRKARCMLLISGYENALYNRMLRAKDGWSKMKLQTHTRDTEGKDYARTEVLWRNRQFLKAHKTGRVPVRLSRKERANNKVNPKRGR